MALDLYNIKMICNGYLDKKKGYVAEIDNYQEDDQQITFDVRILKNGAFKTSQYMQIRKASGIKDVIQLGSQIARLSALIINSRI